MLNIRLFAAARDILQRDAATLDCAPPLTIADVRLFVVAEYPELANLVARSRLALNGEFVADDAHVQLGDDLALIPPVSGG